MQQNFSLGLVSLLLTTQFFTLPSQAQSSPTVACRQELAQDINTIINRPQFKRSRWGIAIQNLATQEAIYSLESDKFFIPASTVKLLTTAAALNELGADFRITTPIYATGKLPHLETVRIQGNADPTITSEILKNIVQQFKVLGISSIKKLIIDDSYLAQPVINPTWEWVDTYYYYATAVNSVILNQNTVRLTLVPGQIGQPVKLKWNDAVASQQWQVFNQAITTASDNEYSIEIDGVLGKPILNIRGDLPQDNQGDEWDLAIVDPANYFLETFRNLLSAEGITVTEGIVTTESIESTNERIITQMYSPPLKELIVEINQDSNNLYAEVLLKVLAKELKINDEMEALETSLNKLGINTDNYSLIDASGLSRQNLITPNSLVKVLSILADDPTYNIYQNSLSLAGSNGTLKHRLRNTELQNNLWGKTGSLSGVITLSGYVKLTNQNTLALSILVNNFDDKNKIVRQAMDEIILLLPKFKNCL
ncbi:D-alanyl-D-alanine carboxypeptidase, serine-type, PBP4 family [Hyella patelloides LEGE 07179]|uniref:D-alanyl-D-alanine carboxypeptidase, serine-type, PBP4 family n=1 Tax=Hyella patelloides LEGE 07179 TaxID=945734 RepID=A0A563VV95_9CYAN|nr:D-alanyl-D-alanine carboxypeptidase/D-alanyl-D-alanine-endopeptidase [Hyella patelloides]VEP15352.1 D-alanyl-D-alanine carboxypeptidase, serine-type, PBP4 family [Hyella patelloides LEGE 07179]